VGGRDQRHAGPGLDHGGDRQGTPIATIPAVNGAQAKHPAWGRSVETLRAAGVDVLHGEGVYPAHAPGEGAQYLHLIPWHLSLTTINARTR